MESYSDAFGNDTGSPVLMTVFILSLLVGLVCVLYVLLRQVREDKFQREDKEGKPLRHGFALVRSKAHEYGTSYIVPTFLGSIDDGFALSTIMRGANESFRLLVDIAGEQEWVTVSHEIHDAVVEGTLVGAAFRIGHSGRCYIERVKLVRGG